MKIFEPWLYGWRTKKISIFLDSLHKHQSLVVFGYPFDSSSQFLVPISYFFPISWYQSDTKGINWCKSILNRIVLEDQQRHVFCTNTTVNMAKNVSSTRECFCTETEKQFNFGFNYWIIFAVGKDPLYRILNWSVFWFRHKRTPVYCLFRFCTSYSHSANWLTGCPVLYGLWYLRTGYCTK